jgi:hypothetical protein
MTWSPSKPSFESGDFLDDVLERFLVDLHVVDGVEQRDLVLAKSLFDLLKIERTHF